MSRFGVDETLAVSGVNLLLNTIDEINEDRNNMLKLADEGYIGMDMSQKTKLATIILTSGDREANKLLINALKELDLEINGEFPHFETIKFLKHLVIARFFDAVGAHNQRIEQTRQNVINKSIGSNVVLEEPRIFSKYSFKRKNKNKKKEQKLLKFNKPEQDDDEEYFEVDEEEDYG